MKLMTMALIALFALSAQAANQQKQEIKIIEASEFYALQAGDNYGSALAVGRMSAVTGQVELVGLTMPDPVTTPNTRTVKGTIDISSTTPGNADEDAAAKERFDYFAATKVGKDSNGMAVSKVVTVVFKTSDVKATKVGCMGTDLEIASQADANDKNCYVVRPTFIIKHSL